MQTQHIALALFLVLVTVGVIVIVSISIVVKRRITRRKSRVERNTYTPCGYGLSKVWREKLERSINATVRVRTEPKVFGPHYEENFDQYMNEKEVTFLYRAKAVDEFLKLKQSILTVRPDVEAPPIRGILAFFLTARDWGIIPHVSRDQIEEYCRLYLWARHDLDPFGKEEYEKLCAIQRVLMESVQRAAMARESAGSGTPSASLSRIHSSKLTSASRSFSKLESALTHQSGDEVIFATPRTSRSNSGRLKRGKTGSKPGAGSLTLKRHRKHELLASSGDLPEMIPMSERKVGRGTYVKQLNELDPAKTESTPVPSTSRRVSCQSDGSQTALINLDPMPAVTSAAKGLSQATRHLRSSEPFDSTEMKPILPSGKEDPSGSMKGGLENQGVSC